MGFEVCGPNEVMVVSGCCLGQSRFIPGGRIFVWPIIQRLQRLSLNTLTLSIESPHVYTQLGVAISVTGIAQVKVQGSNQDMLHAACELFLGKSEREIQAVAQETLEGHQRAIMGNMTVEEIYKDRKKFSKAVFEVASSDLVNMGIYVVSYTLKDIRDDEGYLKALGEKRTAEVKRDARIGEAEARRDAGIKGYLKSLGKSRTAQVKRDARIGEAEARRDAGIKEALAEEKRMESRFANDVEIAKSQRDFELKKAAYDMEVQTTKAQADLAYDLQAAKTKQRIREEQMQVTVIERSQQIQVQEQEITRRERELDAQVRKPAEAEKFRLEKLAEANKTRVIMEAEAESEAIRIKGEAEAFAIEAKARAEAEQMAKKADAWKDYQDAAIADMVLETLPKVAAEIAQPLSHTKKITMVSSGKGDIGASKLTNEVVTIMEKLPQVVENLTGINISKSMKLTSRGK
ncbi:hypothetical protein BaRGS_00011728 [Batillaria attramentaria]|uniref:Band 7 domain-containing protein n=1 Tax=Batillaria attramentaria TaxID=370345 RepID=A0ABD0LDF2_9CAEN